MDNNKKLEILKLRKVTIREVEIELVTITNIEIYESLTQPGLVGYIDIQDYQALFELGNVFAGDIVEIIYSVDNDEQNELILKFSIFTNEGSRQLPLNTYDIARFGFCSPWLIEGTSRPLSKSYSEKFIHEIIEDLLKECGAEIGFIEPTKQKLETFVTPLWSAYHSIKYLLEFAINKESIGGYVCWTDMKTGKVFVTTIDYIIKGNIGTYTYPFTVYPSNYRYSGRVKDINVEASYDIIRMINNGMPTTRMYGFNFDKNEIVKTKNSIDQLTQTRLSKKFPIDKKYKENKYILPKFIPLFPQTADSIGNDDSKLMDMIEGREKCNYSYMSTDVFKINIESLGEINRRVGWLATLDYPSVGANSNQNNDTVGNKQLSGTYLIREIKHVFSLHQDYTQYITLVSDGYKEYQRDLITW